MKTCTKCKVQKELSEFHNDKWKTDGLHPHCKQCHSRRRYNKRRMDLKFAAEDRERSRRFRKEKPELSRWYVTNATLKKKYGITLEEYNDLLRQQNNLCAICSRKCSTGNKLAVDHCHNTGKIRGLLCQGCNTSLGKMNDDPDLLRKAIDYLEK